MAACGGTRQKGPEPAAAGHGAPPTPSAAPPQPAASALTVSPAPVLPPPVPARSWAELKRQVAERLLLANPSGVYRSKAPPVLLAVPVLQIELQANGHIKRISVLREPRQAKDTIELARHALMRAAPFGDMRHLPGPWVFTETFLFDDERRFKPRSLD
ncbi:hypothetical protein I7X39_05460 [Inhella sp. 1Y17]|uniref:TonB C-terminal domain-containing protein n=1 Tax=Inhella proteolytica TaxID=2795029 RepID=A0A931NHB8_9BURK|nr:hypothetical protein [Inhella proteolytica]